jgi:hypothetical protein
MSDASILFVDHTAVMGGAQHSLLDIAEANRRRCAVALFEGGPLADALDARGVPVLPLDGGSTLRAVKKTSVVPGILPIVAMVRLARALARCARPFDLLYANSPKSFVVAALAGRLARKPVVWHLRDILGQGHFSRANIRTVVALAY